MITQRRQTYVSHVKFDSFTVFMRLFWSKKRQVCTVWTPRKIYESKL